MIAETCTLCQCTHSITLSFSDHLVSCEGRKGEVCLTESNSLVYLWETEVLTGQDGEPMSPMLECTWGQELPKPVLPQGDREQIQ